MVTRVTGDKSRGCKNTQRLKGDLKYEPEPPSMPLPRLYIHKSILWDELSLTINQTRVRDDYTKKKKKFQSGSISLPKFDCMKMSTRGEIWRETPHSPCCLAGSTTSLLFCDEIKDNKKFNRVYGIFFFQFNVSCRIRCLFPLSLDIDSRTFVINLKGYFVLY